MTELEYNNELKNMDEKYELEKLNLYKKYAESQRMYSVGDIITNGNAIIKIEKFGSYMDFSLPIPVYIGTDLKKDLR
jgi:hypothetical protein